MFTFVSWHSASLVELLFLVTNLTLFLFTVPDELVDLHIKLLRKKSKYIQKDKWERAFVKFISEYSNVDAWEMERYGYKNVQLHIKIDALKVMLISNPRFLT